MVKQWRATARADSLGDYRPPPPRAAARIATHALAQLRDGQVCADDANGTATSTLFGTVTMSDAFISSFFVFVFLMRLYRALRGCSCGSRGFLEERMMDIITGRAPPPARAESHLPKGSRDSTPHASHYLGARAYRVMIGT